MMASLWMLIGKDRLYWRGEILSENEEKISDKYGWMILMVVIILAISLLLIEFGATSDSVFMGDIGMLLVASVPMMIVVILSGILIRFFRS